MGEGGGGSLRQYITHTCVDVCAFANAIHINLLPQRGRSDVEVSITKVCNMFAPAALVCTSHSYSGTNSGTDPLTTTGADTAGSLALEKEVPCATEATAEPSSTVEKKEEVPSRVVVAQQDGAEVESSLQIYERSGDDVDQPSAVYDVDPLAIEGFRATQGSDLFKAKRRGRLNSAGSKARASDDSAAVTSAEKDAQTMQNSVGREADQASAEESKSGLQQAAVEKGHSAQQRVSFAADVSPGTGSAKEYRAARERLLEKKRAKKRKVCQQCNGHASKRSALLTDYY